MRHSYLVGLGAMVGLTALGIFWVSRPATTPPSNTPASSQAERVSTTPLIPEASTQVATVPDKLAEPTQPVPAVSEQPQAGKRGGPLRIAKGQPIPELFPYEKERGEISELATRSGQASLDALAKYLNHSDAMVREEARFALVRMSSPDAVPILRKAADSAKTTQEAKDLRESATFLALATGLETAESPF